MTPPTDEPGYQLPHIEIIDEQPPPWLRKAAQEADLYDIWIEFNDPTLPAVHADPHFVREGVQLHQGETYVVGDDEGNRALAVFVGLLGDGPILVLDVKPDTFRPPGRYYPPQNIVDLDTGLDLSGHNELDDPL
jgi:hypothetical protein